MNKRRADSVVPARPEIALGFQRAIMVDADGTIRSCSSASGPWPGTILDQNAIGSSVYTVFSEIEPELRAAIGQALQGTAAAFTFERQIGPQAAYFEVQIAAAGDVLAILIGDVTGRLVTERRLAETGALLEETQAALAQNESIAHLGSWENDLVTGQFVWSDELYRLLGLEPGAVNATRELWRGFVDKNDDARVSEAMEAAKATRTPYNLDRRVILADGTVRWLQQQAKYVYDEAGNAIRIVGTSFDITARKEAEPRSGCVISPVTTR